MEAAVLSAPAAPEGPYRLQVQGRLMIAGTERPVQMVVQGQRLRDGRLRATGSQRLLMSDFGIDPPTALMGLIKVRDAITVHFDLVAAADRTLQASTR